MTCQYCDILKLGDHIGGNALYKIIKYNDKIYGIWNDHIGLHNFPFCHGKLTTMKIDTKARAIQEYGNNFKWRQLLEEHITYVFERQ